VIERRLLVASLLTLAVWFGYAEYVRKTAPKHPPAPARVAPSKTPAPAVPPVKEEAPPAATPEPVVSEPQTPERTFVVVEPLYRAVFTSVGGRLKSLELKGYADRLGKGRRPVQLVQVDRQHRAGWPLGLVIHSDQTLDLENVSFKGYQTRDTLIFKAVLPSGLQVTKTYTFDPSSYLFSLEVRVKNGTGKDLPIGIGVVWVNHTNPAHHDSRREGHAGPVTLDGSKLTRENLQKMEGEKTLDGHLLWTGFETKYFLAALIPDQPDRARVRIWKPRPQVVESELFVPPAMTPAGAEKSQTIRVYTGPKAVDQLVRAEVGLEKSVAFGIFAFLAKPLLWVLNFFERFVRNYGVAIILLTIVLRMAFYPLASKQFRSMKEMQRIQPLVQELKEKHKDDRERFNKELMQLYRTHKVNPLGGCLPIVVQIPVFVALYETLLNAIELRQAPFLLWIRDLSAPDHTYVTPVLMTASMFVQQRMSPPMADPAQQRIMMFMPLIFGFMFLNFPSGLVLYWLVNNILSIAQQYWINRQHG
jgi:YidC/Oxa1 family membrane protein insertase